VIVEMLSEIARDMEPITRKLTMKRLAELPVTIHTDARVTRFDNGHALVNSSGGEVDLGGFDTVVVAVGTRPLDSLSVALREHGVEVKAIGDASSIGQIEGAVRSAWEVASRV
jgi:NADH dehydrogenase FAD-containing subunit